MSDVSVHLTCSGVRRPDSAHPRCQSPVSLQAGFYHKPEEVSPCPVSGNAPLGLVPSQVMLHLGALIDTTRGLVFPSPARTETIVHATRALLDLTQVSALRLHQVTGLLASCHALVPLCMFRLRPLSILLRDHFDMRVVRTSKLIPLSSPVIWLALKFWSRWDLVSQGVPLEPPPPARVLTTDASTYGWGAVCGPLMARGVW